MNNPESDRLPPHAPDAERGVLGCIIVDPGMFTEAAVVIRSPEWFYDLRHQRIWQTMGDLAGRGTFDFISIIESLRTAGQLESVGGVEYLNQITDQIPSAKNLPNYLEIGTEKFSLRRTVQVCSQAIAAAYEGGAPAGEVIAEAQAGILAVTEGTNENRAVTLKSLIPDLVDRLEEFAQGHKVMAGLATGFNYLDNMVSGWENGQVYVIAGRPSMGKTSLGLDFLRHGARLHRSVGFFSLEMARAQVAMRCAASEAKISFQKFRNGFLARSQPTRLVTAFGQMAALNILIDDTSHLNGRDIMMRARRMIHEHGIKLIVVDYIQFMGSVEKYRDKKDRVAESSEWMKRIAKTLNIPVIALAQLNREVEKGGANRRPQLSDLAESGDIEQDADFVGALYKVKLDHEKGVSARLSLIDAKEQVSRMSNENRREWYWLEHCVEDADEPKKPWAEYIDRRNLAVLKQRNGMTGDCDLVYYKEQMRFADAWKPSE